MPKRRAASAIGASPTWANQPTTASSRRRRRLVSAPGAPRVVAASSASSPTNAAGRSESTGAAGGADERAEPGHEFVPKGGRRRHSGVVQEAEHPGPDGGERRDIECELERPVVEPLHDLVLAHLVGRPACLERVDPDAHLNPVLPLGLPWLVRQGRLDVHVLWHFGATRVSPCNLALDPVHPERAHCGAVEVPRHQVPVPEAEPEPNRRNPARLAAVRESRRGARPHRLEQLDERRRRHHRRDGADVPQARRAQLQQRIPTARIAQVDAGDGEVERNLLVGLEIKVGQVERLAVDAVPVLLASRQPFRQDRDALVAQQPLVPLEGLAPRRVLRRVARDLVRDGVEGKRLAGVEEDEDEVRDAFQPVELRGRLHGVEPTAATAP